MRRALVGMLSAMLGIAASAAETPETSETSETSDNELILVTYHDSGRALATNRPGPPYRARKRYRVSAAARRDASDVERAFDLTPVDRWPIRSLDIYCVVYRIPATVDRERLLARLSADARVESAQPMQRFATESRAAYDDPYADLQHGLTAMNLAAAHAHATGRGVRIAVVDSAADLTHEDLKDQRIASRSFIDSRRRHDNDHGTAVTSVIAAAANNARGIVGVAPDSEVTLNVACWAGRGPAAVCDSLSLARALDALAADPPDIVNLSLSGPDDALLTRIVAVLQRRGAIVVGAHPNSATDASHFPASIDGVIAVSNERHAIPATVTAPGEQILVATPANHYEFRSGNSIAAAHVSGVTALLLQRRPDLTPEAVRLELVRATGDGTTVPDACKALSTLAHDVRCP